MQEPPLARFEAAPQCDFVSGPPARAHGATLNGSLFRVTTCELLYGPLNCAFIWKSDNLCGSGTQARPAMLPPHMPGWRLPTLAPTRVHACVRGWLPGVPTLDIGGVSVEAKMFLLHGARGSFRAAPNMPLPHQRSSRRLMLAVGRAHIFLDAPHVA